MLHQRVAALMAAIILFAGGATACSNPDQTTPRLTNGNTTAPIVAGGGIPPAPPPRPDDDGPASTDSPTDQPTSNPSATHHFAGAQPSDETMPGDNLPGWKQIFSDDFNTDIPLGAFSGCDNNTDTPEARCEGLKPYGPTYHNWWAYASGWDDTARSGADGNDQAKKHGDPGGVYHPEDTISVSGGALHVRMFRPQNGPSHSATLVPIKCMDRKYGRFAERIKVVHNDDGFKSAHEFNDGGFEIDYPENDYGDQISAYDSPGGINKDTGAKWTAWHTTAIEWRPKSLKFYLDGKMIESTTDQVPDIKMSWLLQNESSILGPYAKPGASAQLDTDWVTCYKPAA